MKWLSSSFKPLFYGMAGVLLLLVPLRLLYLPVWVKEKVNENLRELPGYTGRISDVDLHLYRGAYQIHHLEIHKQGKQVQVPFIEIKTLDLSIQWRALFNGAVTGEVDLYQPQVHFVDGGKKGKDAGQSGQGVDWVQPLKQMMPLTINRFSTQGGQAHFQNFTASPPVDIFVKDIDLELTNISNVTDKKEALPSTLSLSGSALGQGQLRVRGRLNLMKAIPDVDLEASLEQVALSDLNDFERAYAGLDFQRGSLDIFSEIVVNDSRLKGYVKPPAKHIQVLDLSKDSDNPLELI